MMVAALQTATLVRGGQALTTLIFHRVLTAPDPLFPEEVTTDRFEAQCQWIRRWFNVLPLETAVQRLRERSLPPRAAAITFDDGYRDNYEVALPILQRHGLTATFFIATGFMDGQWMWNDRVIEAIRRTPRESLAWSSEEDAPYEVLPLHSLAHRQAAIRAVLTGIKHLPFAQRAARVAALERLSGVTLGQGPMMDPGQIRALYRAGMQIGAHTVNHPILAALDAEPARAEIAEGRATLEALLQAPVPLFAYPNGRPGSDYTERDVALVRSLGFAAAVSTRWGVSLPTTDPFQLRRFTPWDRSASRFGLRLARNLLAA